ncbi:hypothetical protein [Leifsonia sp. Root112D2]|uniref:hypothetical protein n=1 Tax=Leifsonia sp. Root112D2 TaxID=1736426 RepID=UPI000A6C22A8|nr:hypothetical protein [Leifsonia sp. Root112D2]
MIEEPPQSSEQVWRRAAELFRNRLPAGWVLETLDEASDLPAQRPDFTALLTAPDGSTVYLSIETKRTIERRDLGRIGDVIQQQAASMKTNTAGVLVARYLSPPVRAELTQLGLSYIDATGNMRISLDAPALYIGDRGADNDPWRGAGRPRGSLKGAPAARVVRTLLDNARPWRITELVSAAGASVGATYRVVNYLEAEDLISRSDVAGDVIVKDWQKLLREWSTDYNTLQENQVRQYIEPRGLESFLARLSTSADIRYAVTGSVAAANWAPYAPSRSAFVYVNNAEMAEEEWGLRRTEAAANIVLIEPKSSKDIVFANTVRNENGVALAAPAQVAVDLMNGPGRNPAEAEELLTWMADNEKGWRK